jgi:hypothetical protein
VKTLAALMLVAAIAVSGCASAASSSPPAAYSAPPATPVVVQPAATTPAPSLPVFTWSGCSASYQQLNNVDSVIKVSTTLTNNRAAVYDLYYLTVEFLNSAGQEIGSIQTNDGGSAVPSLTVPGNQTVAFSAESDSIYLDGSYSPDCKVISANYEPGS